MIPRLKILAGNWKMNFGVREAQSYFEKIHIPKPQDGTHCVLFVPAYLWAVTELRQQAKSAHFKLGAQNIHWEDSGAFTGELSGKAIQEAGLGWCLIGHSERRQFFGESNKSAAQRLSKALTLGLNTVFCVGETLEQRESGRTESVLSEQLSAILSVLKTPPKSTAIFSVAYEPVWAIGTGKTATVEQAESAHVFIRSFFQKEHSAEFAKQLPILYGGSVTPDNAKSLLSQPNVDGVLVGGASLKPEGFEKIVQSAN